MVQVIRSRTEWYQDTCFCLEHFEQKQYHFSDSVSNNCTGEYTITTVTITTNIATFDRDDRDAAMKAIADENVRRTAASLPTLPSSTAAEMRASYQTIMAARLMVAHQANVEAANVSNVTVKQIVDAAKRASDAQRAAMLAAGPQ